MHNSLNHSIMNLCPRISLYVLLEHVRNTLDVGYDCRAEMHFIM